MPTEGKLTVVTASPLSHLSTPAFMANLNEKALKFFLNPPITNFQFKL
jgi:hypothetical protein